MNWIHDIIDTAYSKYTLIQHPTEFFKFCEFYEELKCKNVLEIGSYLGGTFYALCKLSHPDGLKISIDYPFYKNQEEELIRYSTYDKMKTFAENVHIIVGDSHSINTKNKLIDIVTDKKFDFVFIDGDHTYEGVKMDFEMYSPFLKLGGYIAFHDINDTEWHRACNTHIHKFWGELPNLNKFEFNSHASSMGIGVIQISK